MLEILDKVIAVVPSRSRPEELKKYTYRWLPKVGIEYRIFVEPQQEELYKDFNNVELLPRNDGGISYAFSQAANYARKYGFKYIFKLDDDISSFVRRKDRVLKDFNEESEHRANTAKEAVLRSLKYLEDNPNIGAVGFPYRNEMFKDSSEPLLNKRLQTCYIFRTEIYYPNPQCKVREDFMAYLSLRQAGYSTLRIPDIGINCGLDVGTGQGGLQDFDRKKLADEEMEMIKRQFPNVVFRYAPNNSSDWQVDFRNTKF